MDGGLLLLLVLAADIGLVISAVCLTLAFSAARKRGAFAKGQGEPTVAASRWEIAGWLVGVPGVLLGIGLLIAIVTA